MTAGKGADVEMSVVHVLVVDDSPCWQEFTRMHLEKDPNLYIVATASNGSWAVRTAEALQPDLILLDVSLPGMDGIEAARQIRVAAPRAAILFVSGECDPEIVQAALRAGGDGYIDKLEAGRELRAGIEAVLLGKRFLSRGLAGLDSQS